MRLANCVFALLVSISSLVQAQGRPETTKITIAAGTDAALMGQTIVAKELGYFADEGFKEVVSLGFMSGGAATEALATGSAEFLSTADIPALALRAGGINSVALARVQEMLDGLQLFVAAERGVKTPKDLEGLTLWYVSGTTTDLIISRLIEQYGLNKSRIKLVNLPAPEALAAYGSGQIDGGICWQPWCVRFSEKRKTDRLHSSVTSWFPDNFNKKVILSTHNCYLIAKQDFVKSNPNTVKAVLRAYLRATEFIRNPQNKEAVLDMWSKGLGQKRNEVAAFYESSAWQMSVDENVITSIQSLTEALYKWGRITNKPKPSEFFDLDPLRELRPDLVKVRLD